MIMKILNAKKKDGVNKKIKTSYMNRLMQKLEELGEDESLTFFKLSQNFLANVTIPVEKEALNTGIYDLFKKEKLVVSLSKGKNVHKGTGMSNDLTKQSIKIAKAREHFESNMRSIEILKKSERGGKFIKLELKVFVEEYLNGTLFIKDTALLGKKENQKYLKIYNDFAVEYLDYFLNNPGNIKKGI
jgi:hypothetical protein